MKRSRSPVPSSSRSSLSPLKKLPLSLKKKTKEEANTPHLTFVSDEEVRNAYEGVVPTKTEYPVPQELLSCPDTNIVCKWLCRFVQERRKIDGTRLRKPCAHVHNYLFRVLF